MEEPRPLNINGIDRAHFMAAIAFNAVFVVNIRLPLFQLNGFRRTAFSTLAASNAISSVDFWP